MIFQNFHYWNALRVAFPEAFASPRDYVIQKTVGVFPLHAVAPQIFELAVERSGYPLKAEAITGVLGELADGLVQYSPSDVASKFWDRRDGEAGRYAGQKGFRILTDILESHLPVPTKARVI